MSGQGFRQIFVCCRNFKRNVIHLWIHLQIYFFVSWRQFAFPISFWNFLFFHCFDFECELWACPISANSKSKHQTLQSKIKGSWIKIYLELNHGTFFNLHSHSCTEGISFWSTVFPKDSVRVQKSYGLPAFPWKMDKFFVFHTTNNSLS